MADGLKGKNWDGIALETTPDALTKLAGSLRATPKSGTVDTRRPHAECRDDSRTPHGPRTRRRPWRGRRLAAVLALLAVAGLLPPCGAGAAGEPLDVRVAPGTLDPPNDPRGVAVRPARAWLIARNTGAAALRVRSVTVVGPNPAVTPDVRVAGGRGPLRLRAGETATYPLTVSRRGTGGGTATLLVTYAAGGRTHVATAPLTVAPVPAGDLGTALHIAAVADLDPLRAGRPGTLTVLLTDRLAVPVTVDALTADAPPGVTAGPVRPPFEIAPGQTWPVRLTVSADGARVGAQTLIVNVSASWMQDGKLLRGSAAVPQPLSVGVVGVSDAMTALGASRRSCWCRASCCSGPPACCAGRRRSGIGRRRRGSSSRTRTCRRGSRPRRRPTSGSWRS